MIKHEESYFRNFKKHNPSLILGLIIISFGMYAIAWIYEKNKELEMIDKHAPDPNRGAALLFIIPVGWFFISTALRLFIANNLFTQILQIVIYGLAILLLLKYCFDFCISFGKVTKTNGMYWFMIFFLFPLVIPAMQAELNSHFDRLTIRKKYKSFYN